ncbi:MAG: glycoside hydrolase family 25 protein, partial [Clostridiales bacterium]|nr:glycoside hydrolase family 25 protein [Clostridiales bacterium]
MNRRKQTLLGLLAAAALCCILPGQALAANADAESEDLVYDLDGLLVSDNGEDDMNSWRYEDGAPIEVETEDSNDGIMIVSTTSSDSVAFGIDVSKWQGDIDWDSARSSISFAIIRCGYGSNLTSHDDAYFEANVEACEELGIPYGVYLYSYATSTTEAKSEANHVLRLLSGHTPSLPVYLDLEDSSVASACTNAQILASTKVFCNAIEDAGYEAGVYANKYWWTTYLTSSTYDQWDRWVAQYNTSCTYTGGSFSYWQYSSTGSVSGISGNVDCNYAMSSSPFYDSSTPKIANANLPSGNITATTYAISGIVSSSKKITKIAVNILDSSGTTVQTTTAKPNGKSYELAAMDFSVSTTGLTVGKTYTCQVKATTSSGTTTVAETTFKVVAPQLTSVSNEATGVKVTWEAYSGAAKYRVFRKISGGSWQQVGDTSSTSYTDTTAVSGTTYTYTVRCINSSGTGYTSSYDTTGLTITYIAAPVISKLSNTTDGVTVTWGAVTGAVRYRIFRKTSGTSWVSIGNTTDTSFTDTTAVSGTAYTYTIRCVNTTNNQFTS